MTAKKPVRRRKRPGVVNPEKAAKSRAADAEAEKAHVEYRERDETIYAEFEDSMEYKRKVDKDRAARKELKTETVDPKKDEEEFARKEHGFRESMDGTITPPKPAGDSDDSVSSPPSIYATPPEQVESPSDSHPDPTRLWVSQGEQDSAVKPAEEFPPAPLYQNTQDLPVDVVEEIPRPQDADIDSSPVPMRQSGRASLNDELEELQPIPIPQKPTYQDLKLSSVEGKPPTSIHTGDQLHVVRVPTADLPSTRGTTVMGLHPHASAWTRSPIWAQTIVALGIGTAVAGLSFGFYKLFKKITHRETNNRTETDRLHARDWKRKSKRAKIM